MDFNNKTILITGASRGIGKAIALKLAAAGANIVIAAKSVKEDERLGGTIYSAACGSGSSRRQGPCPRPVISGMKQLSRKSWKKPWLHFGGLDIVVNNASAIFLSNTERTEPKRFDLMFDINVRGTFMVTKYAYPLLKKSAEPAYPHFIPSAEF